MAERTPTYCPLQEICTNLRRGYEGPLGTSGKTFVDGAIEQAVANVDAVKGCIAQEPRTCTFDTQASHNLGVDSTTSAIIFSAAMSIGFQVNGRGGVHEPWRQFYLPSNIKTPEQTAKFLYGDKKTEK